MSHLLFGMLHLQQVPDPVTHVGSHMSGPISEFVAITQWAGRAGLEYCLHVACVCVCVSIVHCFSYDLGLIVGWHTYDAERHSEGGSKCPEAESGLC